MIQDNEMFGLIDEAMGVRGKAGERLDVR